MSVALPEHLIERDTPHPFAPVRQERSCSPDGLVEVITYGSLDNVLHRRWERPLAGRQSGGLTYFAQRQGWVKIGHTNNINQRLRTLASRSGHMSHATPWNMDWTEPLILLRVIDGAEPGGSEVQMHDRFRACRVMGEWFLPDAALRAFLASDQ